jgi:sirohydrochlorin cobaltochelatase
MPRRAIVLFAHGAPDPQWSRTLAELATLVQARARDALVLSAFLEFQPPTLAEAVDAAVTAGARAVDVAPVFWASGGHVASDLPLLLDELRRRHPRLAFQVLPVLSELPGLLQFVADAVTAQPR